AIGGRSLAGISIRERARLIAYVPQVHVPTFAFTVDSVVLMGRTAHGNLFSRPSARDRMVAARVLEQFGIAHLAPRPYTMISGGERQLVLLARALAQEPQFIVLDEPTANLDFGNQGKVMREIRALAGAGHGILFTTHDPNHALRAADRAYLLREGELVAEGDVGVVLTRERLEDLYGAGVGKLTDAATGRAAFLPGCRSPVRRQPAARQSDAMAGQGARINWERLRPISRAPIGMRHTAAVVAQLRASAPTNTIAALATANKGAPS